MSDKIPTGSLKRPLATGSLTSTALQLWHQWRNGLEDGILAFNTELW